jgi:hypothetical protein
MDWIHHVQVEDDEDDNFLMIPLSGMGSKVGLKRTDGVLSKAIDPFDYLNLIAYYQLMAET